jgi:acid phosphatase family membrane protein YuiD
MNMSWLIDLITNPFLLTGISSWFYAQILKTIIFLIINKKLDVTRMVGDGGMPSGHSATVTSIALLIGLVRGAGSVEFAISFILAVIVCHDATGVRRETEKQAFIINELVKAFDELTEDKLPEVKLKQFVGHTPVQVLAGITLGVINAVVMYFVLF